MPIHFPAHIGIERLGNGIRLLGHAHRNMVFIAHLADIFHQPLHIRDFHHAIAAERIELVLGKLTLAGVAFLILSNLLYENHGCQIVITVIKSS